MCINDVLLCLQSTKCLIIFFGCAQTDFMNWEFSNSVIESPHKGWELLLTKFFNVQEVIPTNSCVITRAEAIGISLCAVVEVWMKHWFIFYKCSKENDCYNHRHNILRLFDTLPNFLSSQVKRKVVISNKHAIYVLSEKLSNNFRLRILGN